MFEGGGRAPPNIHCAPTSGDTLSKAHAALRQPSICVVLTELKNWDGIKAIIDCAGIPSTSEETKYIKA